MDVDSLLDESSHYTSKNIKQMYHHMNVEATAANDLKKP